MKFDGQELNFEEPNIQRSPSPSPMTAASSLDEKRRAMTMNQEEESIFTDLLPFKKRGIKLQKIEEADHESFVSAEKIVPAEYNQKMQQMLEDRKSQLDINLGGLEFSEESPEGKKGIVPEQGFTELQIQGGGNSASASEDSLSEGHFDDMRGTFMNHLKVIERDQREEGLCKKMFMTIEPYNPQKPFLNRLDTIQESDEPSTPIVQCENVADEDHTTKDSESPQPHIQHEDQSFEYKPANYQANPTNARMKFL